MISMQPTVSPALPGNLLKKAIQVSPLRFGQRDIRFGHRLLDSNKRLIVQLAQMSCHQSPGRGNNLKLQHCPECLITLHPALLSPKERKDRFAGDLGKVLPVAGFGNKMNFQSYPLSARFHVIH